MYCFARETLLPMAVGPLHLQAEDDDPQADSAEDGDPQVTSSMSSAQSAPTELTSCTRAARPIHRWQCAGDEQRKPSMCFDLNQLASIALLKSILD